MVHKQSTRVEVITFLYSASDDLKGNKQVTKIQFNTSTLNPVNVTTFVLSGQ